MTNSLRSTPRLRAVLGLGLALVTVVVYAGAGQAGNYTETDQTAALGVGGQVQLHRSPTNQGAAMEMDYGDFTTAPGGGTYQVSIVQNSTGRALNLRVLGVNGTIIAQCTTAVNAGCASAAVGLAGNLDFGTIVATGNGAPVAVGSHYVIQIRRTA